MRAAKGLAGVTVRTGDDDSDNGAPAGRGPSLQEVAFRNQREVMRFVSEVTTMSQAKPSLSLQRILGDQGYGADSSDTGSLSSFGGGSMISSGVDSNASSVNTMAKAFFNSKSERTTLKPFVADLTHRCVGELEDGEVDPPLVPWRGEAAVLFIDLSGYSKISSHLISSGGAHAMSRAVNGYFEAILAIVLEQFQGDVIKFAGDAIVVVWAFPGAELRDNAMAAVACAMQLQKRCGMYPVEGTDLHFRMHSGVVAGVVDSEVFVARETYKMQRGFHFVSGKPFEDIGAVVDGAKTGEVCVSQHVADMLGDTVTTSGENREAGVRVVVDVDDDVDPMEALMAGMELDAEEDASRSDWLEKQLVYSRIASKLRQGFKLTHMAEMRFLCVLFIHKAVEAVTVRDWFSELQLILDENRCPIVQIIDDDKGTHVVAAVNLYTSEPDCASTGLRVARELETREVGCSVGMACGECYCGVVGSEDACRWDITGPACVRAARLMQLAIAKEEPSVIDVSVYRHTSDVSQLLPSHTNVMLKGSPDPLTVYRVVTTASSAPGAIAGVVVGTPNIYPSELMAKIKARLNDPKLQRTGYIVNGPVGSGKKTLFLLCTQGTDWTPIVHQCTDGEVPLRIAETLGQWFSYHPDSRITELAQRVRVSWAARRMTHTLDLALKLVDAVIMRGQQVAFVIQYAHLMDGQSTSLVREILRRQSGIGPTDEPTSRVPTPPSEEAPLGNSGRPVTPTPDKQQEEGKLGKFAVMMTCYPLHKKPTAQAIVNHIMQGVKATDSLSIEQYQIGLAVRRQDVQDIIEAAVYWKITDTFADSILNNSGGVAALTLPLILKTRDMFVENQQRMERGEITASEMQALSPTILPDVGLVDLTPSGIQFFRDLSWITIAPHWIARFNELYDVLQPRLQLVLRAVAALVSDAGVFQPMIIPVVQKVMPKLRDEQILRDLEQLETLGILAEVEEGGTVFVKFTTPAMLQVVRSLLTPDQDRVLKRMGAKWYATSIFKTAGGGGDASPTPLSISMVQFAVGSSAHTAAFFQHRHAAYLWRGAGDREKYHAELRAAFHALPSANEDNGSHRAKLERLLLSDLEVYDDIDDVVAVLGHAPSQQSGTYELTSIRTQISVGVEFCKNYTPSPSLGPLTGELWRVSNRIRDYALRVARPGVEYAADRAGGPTQVDVAAFIAAIDVFEKFVNDGERAMPLEEERAVLERLTAEQTSLEAVDTQAAEFMEYEKNVWQPRRQRFNRYATLLDALPASARGDGKPSDVGLRNAFERFLAKPQGSDLPLHEDLSARSDAFNAALMDLALARWSSPYPYMGLHLVRDAVRRLGEVEEMELKTMVTCCLLFGTALSSTPAA